MPLLEVRNINAHTILGRWALTETIAQLRHLSDSFPHLVIPDAITHEKRQREWLASRLLAYQVLQNFTLTTSELLNDINGKPYFTNNHYRVSLSHTQSQVSVLISDKYEVGIDIETIQPKVLRVKNRFLSLEEKQHIGDDLYKLIIAWSAKEALYKLYGKKNIIFADHLQLSPFNLAPTGLIKGTIINHTFVRSYNIHFECYPDTVLTLCFDDNLL